MNGLRSAALAAAEAAPGRWFWHGAIPRPGNGGPPHISLAYMRPDWGVTYVMDFARLGMQGAQPRFEVDGKMEAGRDLAIYEKDYRDDIIGFDSPYAIFMAEANPTAVLDLIDRLAAAEARSDLLERTNQSMALRMVEMLEE